MAGAKYLAWLLKRFNGNTSLALAGYNAGEGNVAKYGGVPPFRETQDYVRRVTSRYRDLYAAALVQVLTTMQSRQITLAILKNQMPFNTQSDNYTAGNHQIAANKRPQRQIIMATNSSYRCTCKFIRDRECHSFGTVFLFQNKS